MSDRRTIFSEDRVYRYTLWREWSMDNEFDIIAAPKPDQYVQFIGLNPSTADETKNDPTVRKCIQFAKRWGYGGMCMTNLFAFRATDPRVMKLHASPIGPENNRWLQEIARSAGLVVAAWGNHGSHLNRASHVRHLLSPWTNVNCLRITKAGQPEHPLYIPYTTKLQAWSLYAS